MVRHRDDLLVGPKEKAIEAVKTGEKEEAIKYIEELSEEFRPLHDMYCDWIQFLLSFIGEKLGEDTVEEALRGIALDTYNDRFVEVFKTMSPEEITKMSCTANRTHYSDFYVEEDDDKFVVVIPYCNSGGRLQKQRRGRKTEKAYPWSYDQEGVRYYCCHGSVFNQVFKELGIDNVTREYYRQFDDEGKPTGGACRHIAYKQKA